MKKIIFLNICIILSLLTFYTSYSQEIVEPIIPVGEEIEDTTKKETTVVPNFNPYVTVSPMSPNAAALSKYGMIPVDYCSGTASVSIPIWEIKGRKLSLPVSLNYHASGVRIEEMASDVGLGWSLNAGGLVTRVVRGLPDETPEVGYFEFCKRIPNPLENINTFTNWKISLQCRDSILKNKLDTEPDLFIFNCNGISGKFMFRYDYTLKKMVCETVPYSNLKIEVDFTKNQFIITDGSGTRYIFGKSITNPNQALAVDIATSKYTFLAKNEEYNIFMEYAIFDDNNQPLIKTFVTAWYLVEIIAQDEIDKISLTYDEYDFYADDNYFANACINNDGVVAGTLNTPQWLQEHKKFVKFKVSSTIKTKRLKEISSSIHILSFNYSDEGRLDVREGICPKLNSIDVKYGYNSVAVKYELNHSYFTSDESIGYRGKRLRLDLIKVINPNYTLVLETYKFSYYNPSQLRPRYYLYKDHWGYVGNNGKNKPFVDSILPYSIVNTGTITNPIFILGPTREPYVEGATNGMLKEITFPGGGTQTLEYEPHVYNKSLTSNDCGNLYTGGVRIKKITLFDALTNVTSVKSYTYDSDIAGKSSGYLFVNFDYVSKHYYYNTDFPNNNYYVKYSDNTHTYNFLGNHILYENVKEVVSDNVKEYKKTYKFMITMPELISSDVTIPVFNHLAYNGLLLETKTFDNNNNVIDIVTNIYKNDNIGTLKKVTPVVSLNLKGVIYRKYDSITFPPPMQYLYRLEWFAYKYSNYVISNDFPYLEKTITQKFYPNSNNSQTVTQDYIYNFDKYSMPVIVKTYNPNGEILFTKYKYPHDYNKGINTAIDKMLDKNILNVPIEVQNWKLGSKSQYYLLNSTTTEYGLYRGNNVVMPNKVYSLEIYKPTLGSSIGEDLFNFQNYTLNYTNPKYKIEKTIDYNSFMNVISVTDKYNQSKSFLYEYSQTLPVAEITNAKVNHNPDYGIDASYSGFEALSQTSLYDYDNWIKASKQDNIVNDSLTKNATSFNINNTHTGNSYALVIRNERIKKKFKPINQNRKFIFSIWTKTDRTIKEGIAYRLIDPVTNQIISNSTVSIDFRRDNQNWNFYSILIDLPEVKKKLGINSDVVIECYVHASEMSYSMVDDIRFCPTDAVMNTTTYDKLLGKTSETDNNNNTLYYIYKLETNKLEFILNSDKKVIRKYIQNILK